MSLQAEIERLANDARVKCYEENGTISYSFVTRDSCVKALQELAQWVYRDCERVANKTGLGKNDPVARAIARRAKEVAP